MHQEGVARTECNDSIYKIEMIRLLGILLGHLYPVYKMIWHPAAHLPTYVADGPVDPAHS